MRAIARTSLRSVRPPRFPRVLRYLYSVWSALPVSYDNRMLWATCSIGFFAFLRSGMFTCSAVNKSVLAWGDVRVNSHSQPVYLVVHLRQSKTDIFGAGVSLYVGKTGCDLCPVAAALSYLAVRPQQDHARYLYFRMVAPCVGHS